MNLSSGSNHENAENPGNRMCSVTDITKKTKGLNKMIVDLTGN